LTARSVPTSRARDWLTLALMPVAGGLATVVGLRLLMGLAEAAFFVAGFTALMDLAPADRIGQALSYN